MVLRRLDFLPGWQVDCTVTLEILIESYERSRDTIPQEPTEKGWVFEPKICTTILHVQKRYLTPRPLHGDLRKMRESTIVSNPKRFFLSENADVIPVLLAQN